MERDKLTYWTICTTCYNVTSVYNFWTSDYCRGNTVFTAHAQLGGAHGDSTMDHMWDSTTSWPKHQATEFEMRREQLTHWRQRKWSVALVESAEERRSSTQQDSSFNNRSSVPRKLPCPVESEENRWTVTKVETHMPLKAPDTHTQMWILTLHFLNQVSMCFWSTI